jgi:23S rRNA (adenine2503-C2)-methyltransferase
VSPARPPTRDAVASPPVPLTLSSRGDTRPKLPRGKPPRHLADLDLAGRRAAVVDLGEPSFRAVQLSKHFFGRYTEHPDDMTDLPRTSRAALAGALLPALLTAERELSCDDGTTRKTLWRAFDGALVESVLMRYPDRVTMCVSSQAGCGMACPFCATGQAGLTRNLSTAEIVGQVVAGARVLADGRVPGGSVSPGGRPPLSPPRGARVSNVVFMGMGEPLANYANVVTAVRRLTEPVPEGMGISQRSVTVSTVGLVPAIGKLAAEGLSVTLAVSLHAPDDELRDTLVPVNRRWQVAEVLDSAWDYAAVTGRRVSIEYALIKDINDQAWRADLLGSLLAGRLAHVNLIPLNPTPGSKWTASRPGAQREFVRRLESHGVPVTVRDTRGREIDGACGQLAASARAAPPASANPSGVPPAVGPSAPPPASARPS